jgi:hypothetical protein
MRELAQERIRLALGAERRQPHVPRVDGGLVRIGVEQLLDRAQQRRPVAARKVDATDRALEQHVAGEQRPVLRERVSDVAGAVAGDEADLEREAREVQRLAAADGVVRVVALKRAEAGPADVGVDVGQHLGFALRAVDRRAGRARHRGHGSDVVEVGVGEEDRLDRHDVQGLEGVEQPLGLVARVDDHGALGVRQAHEVAVLLHRPNGEHPCVDHGFGGRARRAMRRRYMKFSM